MEIEKFNLKNLRNEEHYQFYTDVNALIVKYKPATLGIDAAYAAFTPLLKEESDALELITKSAVTANLETADHDRDVVFRGFVNSVNIGTTHFKLAVRQAASKLKVVFDHYGNLATLPYDQETASLTSLITDLNTTYKADVTAAGFADWVTELTARNTAFATLMASRNTEGSGKTQLRMKQVRVKVDAAYLLIVKRINSLAFLNGDTVYAPFINEMNVLILRYESTIAKRRGTAAAAATKANTAKV